MIARSLLLLGLLALTGCSLTPSAPGPQGDWEQRVAALAAHRNWTLSGKVGVRAPSGNGAAALEWSQHDDSWRLLLSGALGMGRLTLEGNDHDGVSWRDTRGRSGHHADPEVLISELWGWPLPVTALEYWARGIPQPGVTIKGPEFDSDGRLRFTQSGWQVEAGGYREVDGFALPTRLLITRHDVRLTLVVHRWSLSAP